MQTLQDRNFDDLAAKFARKIYGSLKGQVRQAVIWRDLMAAAGSHLQADLEAVMGIGSRPLRVLDLGGGLGQFSIRLAALGHTVTYNDISARMVDEAQCQAKLAGCFETINWQPGSYQSIVTQADIGQHRYDLILAHAMIEWLAEPHQLIAQVGPLLSSNGLLSLSYYNRHGWEYRNLLRGNFNLLERPYQNQEGSLTPLHAFTYEQITQWLTAAGLNVSSSTGIRVFCDYTREQRGGLSNSEAVVAKELEYSTQQPYKWLGRYIHLLAGSTADAC